MFRAVQDIVGLLGKLLPPWALATVGAVLLIAAIPIWLRSMRNKRISGLSRRLVRAEGQVRQKLVDEIFAIAGESPALLLTAVEQAIRYDQRDVRDQALAALDETGRARADVVRIRGKLRPEPKPVPHPLEVAVNVERLLEQGMVDTAHARLDEALDRYPGDPDLLELRRRTNATESKSPGTPS